MFPNRWVFMAVYYLHHVFSFSINWFDSIGNGYWHWILFSVLKVEWKLKLQTILLLDHIISDAHQHGDGPTHDYWPVITTLLSLSTQYLQWDRSQSRVFIYLQSFVCARLWQTHSQGENNSSPAVVAGHD